MLRTNPRYVDPEQPTIKAIKALASLGRGVMPMQLMGTILATFPLEGHIPPTVLRYVFGPVIYHQGTGARGPHDLCWLSEEIMDEWVPHIYRERVEILCGERPDICSPTELWLVAMNATYDHPMESRFVDLYCWAVDRSLRSAGKQEKADAMLKHISHGVGGNWKAYPPDEAVLDPTGILYQEYYDYCAAIIRKVVGNSKVKAVPRARPLAASPAL